MTNLTKALMITLAANLATQASAYVTEGESNGKGNMGEQIGITLGVIAALAITVAGVVSCVKNRSAISNCANTLWRKATCQPDVEAQQQGIPILSH